MNEWLAGTPRLREHPMASPRAVLIPDGQSR